MKGKKAIGIFSILLTIPSLLLLIVLLGYFKFPYSHWLIIEKLIIVFCGSLGGVILLVTRKHGYVLLFVMLAVIFFSAISRVLTFFFRGQNKITMDLFQSGYELAIGSVIILLFWIDWKRSKGAID